MARKLVKSPRLYQQIADKIVAKIESEAYPKGGRLPAERELANLYAVSRPTIREAIIALEIEGYVEVRTGSGVYVLDIPQEDTQIHDKDVGPFQLTEARALFEGEAAALAANLIDDDEIALLRDIIDKMEIEEDTPTHEALDKEFHMIVARATRNEMIADVIEDLWDKRDKSALTRRMYQRVRNHGVTPSTTEHRDIFLAIEKRDPKQARSAMRRHLTRVIDGILEATEIDAVEAAKSSVHKNRTRYSISKMMD